jgi:hypothetical protein
MGNVKKIIMEGEYFCLLGHQDINHGTYNNKFSAQIVSKIVKYFISSKYFLGDCDTGYSRGTCTPMFIAALFTIAKLWKQPRCPTTD